jgi:hypothetical protein
VTATQAIAAAAAPVGVASAGPASATASSTAKSGIARLAVTVTDRLPDSASGASASGTAASGASASGTAASGAGASGTPAAGAAAPVDASGPAASGAAAPGAASAAAPAARWEVAIAAGGVELARHSIGALREGPLDYPVPLPAVPGLGAKAIEAAIEALRGGSIEPAAALALGRHLFAALCGPAWPAIEAHFLGGAGVPLALELALDLDAAPGLRGLPWELMASPTGWLAGAVAIGGALVDVAITRRTARRPAASPPLAHPLRYLFVIGTGIDDAVRSGAECLGLLRQIAPEVQERIVQRQSLDQLTKVITEFDPHVVHVVCHGRETEQGGVELELWDGDRNEPAYVPGAALADVVVRVADGARRAPAIVVLSACSSGERLATPGDADLARTLVGAGVPIVIGMAAEIRDQACRLFARGLGTAITDRSPVLFAAVQGRRAALRSPELPADALDWGLVQLVLGHDVDAGLAVVPASPGSEEQLVMDWLAGAALPIDLSSGERTWPPLCGGAEMVDTFYRLMSGAHAALVLVARPPREGVRVGKRRAMAELAAAAIRAGHLPVLLMPTQRSGWPRTVPQLVERLRDAFQEAWIRHGLGDPPALALARLAGPPLSGISDGCAPAVPIGPPAISVPALMAALEADCAALRTAARARHPMVARVAGQVVLMFHDAHAYGDGASTILDLLMARGAALRNLARVVVSWQMTPPDALDTSHRVHDDDLKGVLAGGRAWIRTLDLLPLAPIDLDRDDLGLATIPAQAKLALQRVLLHPFRLRPAYATRRWFLDLGAERQNPAVGEALRVMIANTYGCCPGQFSDDGFLLALNQVRGKGVLVEAKDDDVLKAGGRPR